MHGFDTERRHVYFKPNMYSALEQFTAQQIEEKRCWQHQGLQLIGYFYGMRLILIDLSRFHKNIQIIQLYYVPHATILCKLSSTTSILEVKNPSNNF